MSVAASGTPEQAGTTSSGRSADQQRPDQQGSGGSPAAGRPDNHKCCRGLLYFSQALHDKKSSPVCAGLRTTRAGAVEDVVNLRPESVPSGDFKYLCIGLSVYQQRVKEQGAQQRAVENVELPYCNGLEIISAPQVQPNPVLLKEGADGMPTVAAQPPDPKPVTQRPGRSFVSQTPPDTADEFPERFAKSARKLLHQMGHNLTLIGSAMKKLAENSVGKDRD